VPSDKLAAEKKGVSGGGGAGGCSARTAGTNHPPSRHTGVLRHPEGPHRELAVPDLRPRRPAQVSAVPQERGSAEAHPERDEMGPR